MRVELNCERVKTSKLVRKAYVIKKSHYIFLLYENQPNPLMKLLLLILIE